MFFIDVCSEQLVNRSRVAQSALRAGFAPSTTVPSKALLLKARSVRPTGAATAQTYDNESFKQARVAEQNLDLGAWPAAYASASRSNRKHHLLNAAQIPRTCGRAFEI